MNLEFYLIYVCKGYVRLATGHFDAQYLQDSEFHLNFLNHLRKKVSKTFGQNSLIALGYIGWVFFLMYQQS